MARTACQHVQLRCVSQVHLHATPVLIALRELVLTWVCWRVTMRAKVAAHGPRTFEVLRVHRILEALDSRLKLAFLLMSSPLINVCGGRDQG